MTQLRSKWIMLSTLCLSATVLCGCMQLSWFNPVDGFGCCSGRSLAIPETYPLGSVNRAHYHTMQANGEAVDFIIHRHEFVGSTAELTPFGKDHITEIAARARSTPFPVVVERTENNSDPERDEHRRRIIAQILTDFGVPEADQRTVVATSYGKSQNSRESEIDYYQFIYSRGFGSYGGGFGNNGFGGGFGGAAGSSGFGAGGGQNF